MLLTYTFSVQNLYAPAFAQTEAAGKTLAFNSLPSPLTPPIVRATVAPEGKKGKRKVPPPASATLAHYQRAQIFKQKGDQSHALIELIKSTQENPKFVKAYYELALIFRERGYFKLAQSTLEQALAIKNDYSEARILLASLQLQQGNLGGAMSQLGQTIGISMPPIDKANPAQKELPAAVLQSLHSPIQNKQTSSIPQPGSEIGEKTKPNPIKAFWIKPYPRIEAPKEEIVTAPALVPDHQSESGRRSDTRDPAEPNSFASLLHLKNPFSFFRRSDKGGRSDNTARTSKAPKAKAKKAPRSKERKKKEKKKGHSWFKKFFDSSGRESSLAGGQFIPKPAPKNENDNAHNADLPEAVAPAVEQPVQRAPVARSPVAPVARAPVTLASVDRAQEISERQPSLTSPNSSSMPRPFQSPDSVLSKSTLFHAPQKVAAEEKAAGPKPYPGSDDPWSVRLRYLADHGTTTLKEGEAFMFSEDSGEATLFLADGKTVRRQIYVAKDSEEVIKERRPDILTPDDLMYNVSLLAKLMPHQSESAKQSTLVAPRTVPAQATAAGATPAAATNTFGVDNIMGKSQSFWGWIKGVLKI